MEFKSVDKVNQRALAPFFAAQRRHMGDFSHAFMFMWNDTLKPAYAIVENCLVIREYFGGKCFFHFPLSLTDSLEEEMRAVAAIEEHCRKISEILHFTNVPKSRVADMVIRYGAADVTNSRRWRDYLYLAEEFKSFPGKKYAGQRNHVRKFEKLYSDWQFREAIPSDMGAINAFLREYEAVQRRKKTHLAEEEMNEVFALLPHIASFGLYVGILMVEGKIVGFSVGERCGDTVIIHVEKALRDYGGAGPFLAQQFARRFCGDGVIYLNRMDDAGDLGLRKSKLQYQPIALVDKFNVIPRRPIEQLSQLPTLATERLTLLPVREEDAAEYARLASDIVRNRYWGYDWRTDCKNTPDAEYFLMAAREEFCHRREMPLGMYAEGRLVGEVVLHNFGYTAQVEVGVRLLPEFEGKGYAKEAVRTYSEYAFSELNIERVEAKCYRENARSRAMLLSAGMREIGSDDTFYYFVRTPGM
ncbi:MAG: GNAT family N-acetyltransferase [Clostridia bacterium]|nr:GNAT family N-acetyltransferase [Clostridia bacterium]